MVDVMVTYLQSGSGKTKTTWAGGGSGACKTSFKTHMVIKDKGGNSQEQIVKRGKQMNIT